MANELKFGNKVVFVNGNPITLPILAADPVAGNSQGDMYFNSVSLTVRVYDGSVWGDVGSNTLLGLPLPTNDIIVGDGSSLSAQIDTSSVGDILADSTSGLTIKSGVITNSEINTSAAIAFSKLASLTSAHILVGSAGNVATDVAVSGDISISNTGATAYASTVPINKGGTGQTSATAAFNALSPMTTLGDIIYGGASGAGTRLGVGSNGDVLTVAAGVPSWAAPTSGANTALSNLAAVAINTALLPGTTNSLDFGSSSKTWVNAWMEAVKAVAGDLLLTTTASNGNVAIQADGTGNIIQKATIIKQSQSAASSNYKEMQYFDALTLAANTSAFTAIAALTFDSSAFRGAILEYSIRESTSDKQRIGRLYISSDGTISSSSDQYSETAQVGSASGLQLQAAMNGTDVEIQFNNTDASNDCTMRAEITRFRA